ncbi:MAG: RNA polymerase sigma-I factor [Syntrophomonadaceae bacterium]|jgi:RNA polymerase sigma factor|nr:RNA polymerase sigma-I factor [Syntrophomonadaceae bacterium]
MDLSKYDLLIKTISKIKDGDYSARERLVEQYKPFILKTASQFCHRMLEWGRDDELSIGLIAFNSAIDSFEPGRKVPFLAFCRVVIINRLKDYYRQTAKYQADYRFDDEKISDYLEHKTAWESFRSTTIEDERREEIEEYERLLSDYGISFEDLVKVSPRHRDYRINLLRAAFQLAESPLLMEYLTGRKQLPLNELEKASGLKRKTLERGRKFIIASALILSRPEQFVYLRSYIDFESK